MTMGPPLADHRDRQIEALREILELVVEAFDDDADVSPVEPCPGTELIERARSALAQAYW